MQIAIGMLLPLLVGVFIGVCSGLLTTGLEIPSFIVALGSPPSSSGTSLAGGRGRILRTILGVLTIVLIRNFLNLARIEIFWQDFATGVIILAAVLLNSLQGRIARRI